MKKSVALVLKILLITILLVNEAVAQQCSENTNVNGIAGTSFSNGTIGQSFTACKSGKLASVSVQAGNASIGFNNVIAQIFSGDGFGGALLATTAQVHVKANRTTTWSLTANDIDVVEGQKYTARFLTQSGTPMMAYGSSANPANDYYSRGRVHGAGQAHHDMFFSAVIATLSDPVKSPVDDAIAVTRDTQVKLTFSRAMEALTGDITINNATDATTETIDVTTLIIDGADVFMPFNTPLEGGKDFEIIIPANALQSTNGILFPGLAAGEWTFSTSTSPFAVLSTSSAALTNDAVIPFSIDFSDVVTGFELADFVISNGAASNLSGTGDSFTFDVTPSADGEVVVSLPTDQVEAGASNGNDSTGYSLVYDGTVPSVELRSAAAGTIQTSVFEVEVVFSEPVIGFESSDLLLTNANVLSHTNLKDSLYTISLRAVAEGQVIVDLPSDIANDLAGNANTVAPAIIDFTFSVDLESDLLSFYPFAGNADDTVSTGFNGTVTGATLTTGFDGTVDGAYSFDGSDQITFGDTPIGAGSFTLAFWVKIPTGLPQNQVRTILGKRVTCGEGRFFEIGYVNSSTNGHQITVEQRNNASVANPVANLSSVGEWMHVAYVKDNDQLQSSLYINGVQQTPVGWSSAYNFENTTSLKAGVSACNGNGRFRLTGDMDDLYVYGRALTAVEVDLLIPFVLQNTSKLSGDNIQAGEAIDFTFNRNLLQSTVNTANITAVGSISGAININIASSQNNLVVSSPTGWPLNEDITISLSGLLAENGDALADKDFTYSVIEDEAVGLILHYPISQNANEAIGNIANQDGTISGALFTEGFDGDPFGALSFDGVDDLVTLGDAPISTESFSISLWMKVPADGSTTANTIVFSKREACGEGRMINLYYRRSGDKYAIIAGLRDNANAGSVVTGSDFPVDEWVNVTFVKDNATKQSRLIINGVLEAEAGWALNTVNLENNAPLRLGATPCNGVNGELRFDGIMDEVRIYDRAVKPRISSITPAKATVDAAINTEVTIAFNKAVDVTSLEASTISITDANEVNYPYTTAFSQGDSVLTITPDNIFPKGKKFTIVVDTLSAVSGANFLPFQTTFTTVESQMLSHFPLNGVSDVDSLEAISFKFDSVIDMASLDQGIQVIGSMHGPVEGSFTMPTPDSVVFTPSIPYFPNETVTVYVTPSLQDEGGESIGNSKTFAFHAATRLVANATLSFELSQLSTGTTNANSPRTLIAADIDNDGDLDLIGGNDSPGVLFYFENLGFGNYGSGQVIAANKSYFDVKATDFDFDGDVDIITVDRAVSQGVYWYENDGSANFTEHLVVALPNSDSRSIAIADYNNDGSLDVAVASFGSNRLAVFERDGSPLYAAANVGGPLDVQVADRDNDGDMDLYTANYTTGNVASFGNGGNGTFGAFAIHSATHMRAVIPIDFDKDGDIDVVYSSQTDSQIGILENTGNFTYTNHQVGSIAGPHRIDVGDIDGDGDFDIIYTVASGSDINFFYLENSGSLGLWVSKKLVSSSTFSGAHTQTVKFADIDNDGDLDVLATDAASGFYIFENKIIDLNNGPIVQNPIADQTMEEDNGTGLTIDISNVFTDAEEDPFTMEVTIDDPSVTATINGSDLDIIAAADFFGTVNVTITADDGNGTNNDSFILDVTSVNDAPEFTLSTNALTLDEDFEVTELITVTQNQPANEDAPTYTIVPVGDGVANVTIDEVTGEITIVAEENVFGSVTYSVTANDGASSNNTATQEFILTIISINDEPTVENALVDFAFAEDETSVPSVNLGGVFVDVEDASLAYEFNLLAGSTLISAVLNGTSIDLTAVADAYGLVEMEVIATDLDGDVAKDTVEITVNSINDAPAFTTTGDITLTKDFAGTESVTVTADAISFGEETQLVTYTMSPASISFANVTIDGASGEISITAVASEFGSQEFTITADDAEAANNIATQTFTLTIVDNLAPEVIATIMDTTIDEDQATLSVVDVTTLFSDPESDALTYSVSDDFNGSVTAAVNGNNILEVTPSANYNGSGIVTVSASDANQTASTSFTLTVNSINDIPTVGMMPSDQQATEDQIFNFTLPAGVFEDVDGDEITITIGAKPEWLAFDGAILSGTPSNSEVGTSTVELIGSDGNGGSVMTTFSLTVENVNDAPTVVASIADLIVDEDAAVSTISLATVFEDIDVEDQLTISVSAGETSLIDMVLNGETLEISYAADAFGSATVTVTATDGSGATAVDQFTVTVNSINDAPVLDASTIDQQATEDQIFSYVLPSDVFADVDGDVITISAGTKPDWLAFDGTTFSGTPSNSEVGTATVEVIGSDGNGGTATSTFSLTVQNVNDAPTVVAALADVVVDEDAEMSTISLTNVFEDVDAGDQLTITQSSDASNIATFVVNGENLEITYLANASGSGLLSLTATDGSGATATDEFTVTVNSVNDAPLFDLSETSIVAEQDFTETLTINVLAETVPSDESDQVVTYTISTDDTNIVDATMSGNTINLSAIAEAFGEQTFTVTADDGQAANNKHEITFTVIVNQVLSVSGDLESVISIYPNPVAEYVMIDTEELVDVRFFGLNGQLLKEINQVNGKVDVSSIEAGTYLMEVSNSEEKITVRIHKAN